MWWMFVSLVPKPVNLFSASIDLIEKIREPEDEAIDVLIQSPDHMHAQEDVGNDLL